MGIGNFGLGCQCCGGGGGDEETCENNCLEMQTLSDDVFIWQGVTIHTIDLPQIAWCAGVTKRITIRGWSDVGIGADIWPGGAFGSGSGQFGSPGGFTGNATPFVELRGTGGRIRITGSSHTVAKVTGTVPTTTAITLPYTLPGSIVTTEYFAFDIPRVNYANPFDYTVWVDIELIDHEIVCGIAPTSTLIGLRAGTWRRAFGPNNFTYWGMPPSTVWGAGYSCVCPPPDPV